jgi:tight adherence protein C
VTPAALTTFAAGLCAAAAIAELALAGPRAQAARTRLARLAALIGGVGRRIGAPAPPGNLSRRLEAAGSPAGATVGDVMAVKCGAAAIALLGLVPLATALPGRLGPAALAAAPAGGFVAPDAWLRRRARRRGRAMAAEMADVLDLLHVAVDAGLAPTRALAEVGARRGGAFAAELRRAAARIELGVPRAEALEAMARRCPVEGAEALVAALARAERHGAPLGPALRALAADARARRAQRLRERAARAAPKIQLVVALLLVPATMLLVAAALLAGLR